MVVLIGLRFATLRVLITSKLLKEMKVFLTDTSVLALIIRMWDLDVRNCSSSPHRSILGCLDQLHHFSLSYLTRDKVRKKRIVHAVFTSLQTSWESNITNKLIKYYFEIMFPNNAHHYYPRRQETEVTTFIHFQVSTLLTT